MRRTHALILALLLPFHAVAATRLIFDFESELDGWGGKTALSSKGATQGKGSMEIDATGSSGWNQVIALNLKNGDYGDCNELQLDVTVPQGTCAAAGFIEFIPIFSGPKQSWYPLEKIKLKDGLNSLSFAFDGNKVGTPKEFHLVLNSGRA